MCSVYIVVHIARAAAENSWLLPIESKKRNRPKSWLTFYWGTHLDSDTPQHHLEFAVFNGCSWRFVFTVPNARHDRLSTGEYGYIGVRRLIRAAVMLYCVLSPCSMLGISELSSNEFIRFLFYPVFVFVCSMCTMQMILERGHTACMVTSAHYFTTLPSEHIALQAN